MKKSLETLLAVALALGIGYVMFGDRLSGGPSGEEADGRTEQASGGGGAAGGPEGGGRQTVVTLEPVEVRGYRTVYEAVGTVEALARVVVQSEVTGRVTNVLFRPGDTVAAGAGLVALESRQQELEVARAEAELAEAQDALNRLQSLQTAGSAAVTNVQVQAARTAVELARVGLEAARFDREQRTITAPLDGTIGLTDVTVGTFVNSGDEIATISQVDEVKVVFALPENATEVLQPGLDVRVTLPSRPGRVFHAAVTAVGTEIDPTTRLIEVEATMDNSAVGLTHGTIADAEIAVEREPLPAVPSLALSWGRDGASVFVAEDGVTRPVQVTVAHRVNDTLWVEADLKAGDQIVVEGVQKVREGMTVVTAEQAASGARTAPATSAEDRPRSAGAAQAQGTTPAAAAEAGN